MLVVGGGWFDLGCNNKIKANSVWLNLTNGTKLGNILLKPSELLLKYNIYIRYYYSSKDK